MAATQAMSSRSTAPESACPMAPRIRPEDNCRVNSRHTVISSPLAPMTTGRPRLSRRDSPHLVYPFHLKQFCFFTKLWDLTGPSL
jgi:hypothetical protein